MPNLFGPRRPPTSSPLFPDPTTPPFDPFAAPPPEDAFGPLSTALGDPEAIEPRAYGSQSDPGGAGGLLALLKAFLGKMGGKTGGLPGTFMAEAPSKPWGVRYDTPATRDFGGGAVRQSRGFEAESGRQG